VQVDVDLEPGRVSPSGGAAPQPEAAAGGEAGGDDEDLESFQAWLQSLKR
jgi:hypothetical protein